MKISINDVNKIVVQGIAESPLEACGYLAGREDTVRKVFPMKNVDKSSEHFSLDPEEQFKVLKEARKEGLEIIGVYHTHPETPARPSPEDIRLAFDSGVIYVIVSFYSGTVTLKAFRISKGAVTEKEITVGETI